MWKSDKRENGVAAVNYSTVGRSYCEMHHETVPLNICYMSILCFITHTVPPQEEILLRHTTALTVTLGGFGSVEHLLIHYFCIVGRINAKTLEVGGHS